MSKPLTLNPQVNISYDTSQLEHNVNTIRKYPISNQQWLD